MKKSNGEGSIYAIKDKNGKTKFYRAQIVVGTKADGSINRISKTSKNKTELKDWLALKRTQKNQNEIIEKSDKTLYEVLSNYINNQYNSNIIKSSTYARSLYTLKIIDKLSISNTPIQNVTRVQLNNDIASLTHYSQSVINKTYQTISIGFNEAMLDGIIKSNPFSIKNNIIKPKSEKQTKEVESLTIDEQKAFINELKKNYDIYTDVFYFLLYTGARIGEILALEGKNISLENNFISIEKTLVKNEKYKYVVGSSTKTYTGKREIPIIDSLKPIAEKYSNKGFLFSNIAVNTINSHFKRICKNAGIKLCKTKTSKKNKKGDYIEIKSSNVNTHMLRHTFATRCIEAGVSPVVLSHILGHKDISTTLNTYTSVFNRYKQNEINKINKVFSPLHTGCTTK